MNHVTVSGWFPALPVIGNGLFRANSPLWAGHGGQFLFSAVAIRL